MNPISQIELNAHFRDLERQVATARRSQGAAQGWLGRLWRKQRPVPSVSDTVSESPIPALVPHGSGA